MAGLNTADIIVIVILVICIGAAIFYIRKEKKKGVRCIGCPSAGTCAQKNKGGCSCGTEKKEI